MTGARAMEASDETDNLAAGVVALCRGLGVREFCVCAGARNSALVAVLACDGSGAVRVFRHFDERAAGFFALGRARASGRPVAVVTTSGTAAAELLPAVVEAHYQGVPLVAVTADRPRRFAGSGAPQAVEQAGLFSGYVGAAWDVAAVRELEDIAPDDMSPDGSARPVHLNVRFEEPGARPVRGGAPAQDPAPLGQHPQPFGPAVVAPAPLPEPDGVRQWVVLLGDLPRTLQPEAESFAAAFGAPVWAEAASGLRESPRLAGLRIGGGERALALAAARGCAGVLRIGGVPSCRFWRDLEDLTDLPVVSVAPSGYSGLARPSAVVASLADLPEGFRRPGAGAAGGGDANVSPDLSGLPDVGALAARFPRSEPAMVRELAASVADGSLVLLGNSLPVREWNAFAPFDDRGVRCFTNRGANGIDGLLATFFGLSADEPESWAVVGDLSALYDLNAPWVSRQLPAARRRIAVINNGGGMIFSRLPALRALPDPARAAIENHHDTDFEAWADLWGWAYQRCEGSEIPPPAGDHAVLEIRPDPAETEAFWEAYSQP